MDFTNDKIPILLDPNQGLRAVGIQKLEDLNIKQLQKVAEGVNEKYRIKNYKTLSKAQLINEIKTRFPHLAGKDGKLEDLNLKQLQALTTKYQQDHLIKNIKKMNKAQLIEAIRKVAPHLEDTAEVKTATPEPEPVAEEEAEPEVIQPTLPPEEDPYYEAEVYPVIVDGMTNKDPDTGEGGFFMDSNNNITENGKVVIEVGDYRDDYKALNRMDIEPDTMPNPNPYLSIGADGDYQVRLTDGNTTIDGLMEADGTIFSLDKKTPLADTDGDYTWTGGNTFLVNEPFREYFRSQVETATPILTLDKRWKYEDFSKSYSGNPVLYQGSDGKQYIEVKVGKRTGEFLYNPEDKKVIKVEFEPRKDRRDRFVVKNQEEVPMNTIIPVEGTYNPDNPMFLKRNLEGLASVKERPSFDEAGDKKLVMYGKRGFTVSSDGKVNDASGNFVGLMNKDIKYSNPYGVSVDVINPNATNQYEVLGRVFTQDGFENAIFTDSDRHKAGIAQQNKEVAQINARLEAEEEERDRERERERERIRQDEELRKKLEAEEKERKKQADLAKFQAFQELRPKYNEFYGKISWDLGGGWRLILEPSFNLQQYIATPKAVLRYNTKDYDGEIIKYFYKWIPNPESGDKFREALITLRQQTGAELSAIWSALVNAYKLAVAGEFELSKKYSIDEEGIVIPFNLFNVEKPRKPTLQTKLGVYFPTLDVKGGGNLVIAPLPQYGGIIEQLKDVGKRNVKARKQVDYVPFILPSGKEAAFRKKKEITNIPAHTIRPYDWIGELFSN